MAFITGGETLINGEEDNLVLENGSLADGDQRE